MATRVKEFVEIIKYREAPNDEAPRQEIKVGVRSRWKLFGKEQNIVKC